MRFFVVPGWYKSYHDPQNGIFFKEQALMLQRYGHEVVLIDCTERGRKDYFDKDNFQIRKYVDDGLLVFQFCYPNLFLTQTPRLKRILARYRFKRLYRMVVDEIGNPDGVICHGFIMANNVLTSKVVHCPIIAVEHSSYVLNKRLSRFQVEQLVSDVSELDSFLCVSEALKKSVVEITACDPNSISVLANPLSELFYKKTTEKKSDTFRFICVATINAESKGIRLLIEAFCKAFAISDKVELFILGDGKDYNEMLSIVNKSGRSKQIFMPGRVSREDVKNNLLKSHVFVLPSKYETFGIAYIEALACGLPVITQRNGGSDQIINDSNGILLSQTTIDDYVSAMKSIKVNIGRYDSSKISEDCIKNYSENAYVKKIEMIIDRCKK